MSSAHARQEGSREVGKKDAIFMVRFDKTWRNIFSWGRFEGGMGRNIAIKRMQERKHSLKEKQD